MIRRIFACALILTLAACGGSGNSSIMPSGGNGGIGGNKGASKATKPVKIALVLPSQQSAGGAMRKRPNYISASALGASISVAGSTGGTGSATIDLSTGSTQCSGSGTSRTCAANVTVPIDTDTFTVTVYDAAPVGGAIPPSAHVLGVGSVTQAITPSFAGSVSILIGGTIANIGVTSTFASVPADGTAHQVGIAYGPSDFGNNALGGSNAPFANPITVSLSETAGTTMTLLYNGAASGTTATLKNPGDAIAVSYTGAAVPGDTATVTLSAVGATSQTIGISPMIVSGPSNFYGNYSLSLNGSITAIQMQVAEAGSPPVTTAYTATPATGCTSGSLAAATVGTITGSGGAASFSVTGGSYATATACTIAVSDGTSTVTFAVLNTPVGGGIPLPGATFKPNVSLSPFPLAPASPASLLYGLDGRMWITSVDASPGGVGLVAIKPSNDTVSNYQNSTNEYIALTNGTDGYIWGADSNTVTLDKILPSTGAVLFSKPLQYGPAGIATGPDGTIWATETTASGSGNIARYNALSDTLSEYPAATSNAPNPNPGAIIVGPDGNPWFCNVEGTSLGVYTSSEIDEISPTGTITMVANLGSFICGNLAMQSDQSAVWVTWSAFAPAPSAMRVPYSGSIPVTASQFSGFSGSPNYVAAGADGAIYFTENGPSIIARIANNAPNPYTPVEYPVSGVTNGGLWGIALGPDGNMWFAENGMVSVGVFSP